MPSASESNRAAPRRRHLAGFDLTRRPRYQRVKGVLRRRRRLRIGLIQLIYLVPAVALGLAVPLIDYSPHVDASRVVGLYYSLATGLIALIAVVFSLLFLVVPYANTSLTPRLTLFRDNPIVWHSFSFFVGAFVFLAVGGLTLSNDEQVGYLVPVIALVLVLASLWITRVLQFHAYRSLQLGGTLHDIVSKGERVIDVLYRDPLGVDRPVRPELPPVVAEVVWPHTLSTVRQIDVPRLVRYATNADVVVDLRVTVGDELRRDITVLAVRGEAAGPHDASSRDATLLRMIDAGPDRTFDQDPLFAFRLLVDIAMRSLSSAVNDPITAVQAMGGIHELLHLLLDRDLAIGAIAGADGRLRVVVKVPAWDDYLAIGVDELAAYVSVSPQARGRLQAMVDALLAEAPPARRPALEQRQQALVAPR